MNARHCVTLLVVIGLVLSAGGSLARTRVAAAPVLPEDTPLLLPAPASVDELEGTAWWAAVQQEIQRSEYQITWQDETYLPDLEAAYQAPNRAHNLRTYFTDASWPGSQEGAGVRIIPRTGDAGDWEWGLAWTS